MNQRTVSQISLSLFLILGPYLLAEQPLRRQIQPALASSLPVYPDASHRNATAIPGHPSSLRERTASEATATRVFPWLALSGDYDKELQLANESTRINRSRVLVLTSRELATWDIGVASRTVSTRVPRNSSALAIRSLLPARASILWKRQDHVEWIDRGEEGPPVKVAPGSSVFLIELRSEGAVALQFELEGTEFEVFRAAGLRPSISLLSRPNPGKTRTRVALVATDLKPLDSQFAILVTQNPDALPRISSVLASDPEGNSVPAQLNFNITAHYSE